MPEIKGGGQNFAAQPERVAQEDVAALEGLQAARLFIETVGDGQVALASQRQKSAGDSRSFACRSSAKTRSISSFDTPVACASW